ncbi:S66 peptidase family protein [Romboutsia hominis]|uniref:S66 peptidase family protein n=1 Tax=Romboutsia hominis TaxID=1507512 RepID=UPI001F06DC1C|nr:LD-carboxypeptidase [Romboutsia hominis]MCH1959362.1 LD-carboxypeptidase [Romboutsia hominis]MCH1970260.1 LD-carboxypeptidase [Romboutsia hominis]
MIFPEKLKKGDTIGVIAPASPSKSKTKKLLTYELEKIEQELNKLGYKVKFGKTCYLRYKGYLAGEDEFRVKDIENMFLDKDVNGILCLRGGYGTLRIIDKINYNIIKENPKVFIGYSDITALHIAFNQIANLVTYHGIMGLNFLHYDKYTFDSFSNILSMEDEIIIKNPEDEELHTLVQGKANGITVGGNLAVIISTLGTRYEIDTKNKILFIEEIGENMYKIDRMLTQLELSNKLNDCCGIIFGDFKKCRKDNEDDYDLYELLFEKIKKYNKPCLCNLKVGHYTSSNSILLGGNCCLDATNKSIKFVK